MLAGSSRVALNTKEAVYVERSTLSGGGELELRTYFHQTRRNLIVVELELRHPTVLLVPTIRVRSRENPLAT